MIAFLETTGDRHTRVVSGLPALERRIRELAKAGTTRAIVAAEPMTFARPLPIEVEFVPVGTAPPDGARVERADQIAGVELVDDAACRRAEWTLIRTMNKSFQGPVDALINWRFSMRLTRLLARTSLAFTPNHITMTSIVVGLFASALVLWGSRFGLSPYLGLALGGVTLQVQSILDSCDGELARLRYQYSTLGQWLDNLSDDIVDNLFVLAVGLATGGLWQTIAIAAVATRGVVAVYTYVTVYRKTGTGDVFAFRWWFEVEQATPDDVYDKTSITTWIRSLGRRDTYVMLWMIAALAGFPYGIVGHAAAIASAYGALFVLQVTVFSRSTRAHSPDDAVATDSDTGSRE